MQEKTILLVEDEPIIAANLEMILQDIGYAVVWLEDGAEALQWLSKSLADLVLLNFLQPNATDGMEYARQIKQQHLVPVLLLTGARVQDMKASPSYSIAQRYLLKPFSEHQFTAQVKSMLS